MATVTNETELRDAISRRESEIIIENDINVTVRITVGYAVTIKGKPGVSLFWTNPTISIRDMFYVSGELTIESLILDAENRDGTLVRVGGGTFIMNDGAVLRNINSTSAQNAVAIGTMTSTVGGTFIMNGGLITGVVAGDSAVFCSGGTMIMNNDAEISGNKHSGITLTDTRPNIVRSTLTMTGNSRICNNECKLSGGYGGGGKILGSDLIMGVREGDAPVIKGNRSIANCGGLLFLPGLDDISPSSLTIRYGAEISENYAANIGGGVGASHTDIFMSENAAIKNNECGSNGGGLLALTNCSAVLKEQAQISGNTASNRGGGIFITRQGKVHLTGQSAVSGNIAAEGSDVYKEGALNLSESPKITDGLFFDDLQSGFYDNPIAADFRQATIDDSLEEYALIRLIVPESITPPKAASVFNGLRAGNYAGGSPLHSDNVPVITGTLTDNAHIQLESSGYLSPPNVPLVIADKGPECSPLGETDRAAWHIPKDFAPGYTVILNSDRNQVLIDFESFGITYKDLFGAENSNPDSYTISDLPIILIDPGPRPGYAFAGWYDIGGHRVTEIPEGTTGELTLTAVWERLFLSFDGNAPCVCNIPKPIPVEPDGTVRIPPIVPCRPCHRFICWNIPASGSGKTYFPGDTIFITESGTTLSAQWQPVFCSCHEKDKNPCVPPGSTRCVVCRDDRKWNCVKCSTGHFCDKKPFPAEKDDSAI